MVISISGENTSLFERPLNKSLRSLILIKLGVPPPIKIELIFLFWTYFKSSSKSERSALI